MTMGPHKIKAQVFDTKRIPNQARVKKD